MRNDEADPADDAGRGHARGCHQGGRSDDGQAQRTRRRSRAPSLPLPGGTWHSCCQRRRSEPACRGGPEATSARGPRRGRQGCRAARRSSPGAGCTGSARYFIRPTPAPEEGAHHHAGEHQHQNRIAAPHRGADEIDRGHRGEAAGEGERLDAEDAEREDRCRNRARAQRRMRRPGCRERRAGCGTGPGRRCRRLRAQRRPSTARQDPRPANLQDDVLDRRRQAGGHARELGATRTRTRSPARSDSGRR